MQAILVRLTSAGFDVGPFRPVTRTVLDTFDGRLHGAGLRLVLRRQADEAELVLSASGSADARLVVPDAPSTVAALPPGPFRERLAPVVEARALQPVLTLSGGEALAARRDRSGKIEVVVVLHDRLAVEANELTGLRWAAELRGLEGYAAATRRARKLLEDGQLEAHPIDVVGIVAAAAAIDLAGFVVSPTVPLEWNEPASAAYRKVLANLAGTIEANHQGTVDDVDPEFLHDLRVAVRRSRSVLALGKGVVPSDIRAHLRGELGWLGSATGPARDLDVQLMDWSGYTEPLGADGAAALAPVVAHLRERQVAAHEELKRALCSVRYRKLVEAWRAWLAEPVELDEHGESGRAIGKVVSQRIVSAQSKMVRRGRAIGPTTPGEELHELRKDAKKLRYLLECFGGLFPGKARKDFVQRLRALQDNLGEHQDAEVQSAQLGELSRDLYGSRGVSADTLLALGRLLGILEQRRAVTRHEFAQRFAGYDSKTTAAAFDRLLRSAAER